jgi:folate-binding protein YgfZ
MTNAHEFEGTAQRIGLADRSDRVRLEISGPDRAKFLHNLTTNEIKRLVAGRGCEAFVTSPQGKTIGYLIVLAADDRLMARADPNGVVLALPHLQKYGVFDEVSIEDRSSSTFELHFFGSNAPALAERLFDSPPRDEYTHVLAEIAGRRVRIIRESPTGRPGFTLIGEAEAAGRVREFLFERGCDLGLVEIDADAFEVFRIEAGTPVFGNDVTEKSLPQEFGRDDRAISFVKGCYLGQETVARLDAVGHVNQILKGVVIEAGFPVPSAGSPLESEGKRVGVITSAAASPAGKVVVGLAMIRTTHAKAGTRVSAKLGEGAVTAEAIVYDLPIVLSA